MRFWEFAVLTVSVYAILYGYLVIWSLIVEPRWNRVGSTRLGDWLVMRPHIAQAVWAFAAAGHAIVFFNAVRDPAWWMTLVYVQALFGSWNVACMCTNGLHRERVELDAHLEDLDRQERDKEAYRRAVMKEEHERRLREEQQRVLNDPDWERGEG